MIKEIYNEDIAFSDVDIIVNAANGIGWMGGKRCIKEKHRGVAESLQYASHGKVERLSQVKAKDYGILGFSPGSVFVTEAPNLQADFVLHAVTMRLPGCKSKMETIRRLLPKIIAECESLHAKTVAISLLGTGTGGLRQKDVLEIYKESFMDSKIEWRIYLFEENL